MIFFLDKIIKLKCKWNERPLTEADFYRLCRRLKIVVIEMPLRTKGFYYCVKGKHYIAIDSRQKGIDKLFVMFHEFAHFLRHIPDRNVTANFSGIGQRNFKEEEADIFAYCALLPLTWVKTKTLRELVEDECFDLDFVVKRKEIYENYKI